MPPERISKEGLTLRKARPNHAPRFLGVQGVTRPTHVKLHAPGVHFSTPKACCTTLTVTPALDYCQAHPLQKPHPDPISIVQSSET